MENLSPWFWQLLSKNMAAGVSAAQHLQSLREEAADRAPGEAKSSEGNNDIWGEYSVRVRATVSDPDFPTRDFLLALLEFIELAHEQRTQLFRDEDARAKAIMARLPPEPSPEERKKARRLLTKVLGSSSDAPNSNEQLQRQWIVRQIEPNCIFGCLGAELLAVSDKLRRWANTDKRQYQVSQALERMDVAAKRRFLEDMLALMDQAETYCFSFINALASGIRDDEKTLRSLVERVKQTPGSRAINPLLVLRAVGPRVAELVPDVFPVLFDALDYPQSRYVAIGALGAIGSRNKEWGERIVFQLLEFSRSDDAWIQGAALEALGVLQVRPDLVVPRLIKALDDYEDPDPDNHYASEHLVVTSALQTFGPLAAPAVPSLLDRVRDDDGQLDKGVLNALASIGRAAGFDAWDSLDTIAREVAKESALSIEELLSDEDYPLARALRAMHPF